MTQSPALRLGSADQLTAYADAATKKNSEQFHTLSSLMCWSAVIRCAQYAGAITKDRADRLERINWKEDFSSFVSHSDTLVRTPHEMLMVPPGAFIAFYRVDQPDPRHRFENDWLGKRRIVHAMLSLGYGHAAGNKNSCIGIGHDVGWERLNLVYDLNWIRGYKYSAINGHPLNIQKPLPLRIRYRRLEMFQSNSASSEQSDQSQTLNADKTVRIKEGETWLVGPLSDCVALAAIRHNNQGIEDVLLWHVNGGLITDQNFSYSEFYHNFLALFNENLTGIIRIDWIFVNGVKAEETGRQRFMHQPALKMLFRQNRPYTIRSFYGSDLLINSIGTVLNEDLLLENDSATGILTDDANNKIRDIIQNNDPTPGADAFDIWERLLPKGPVKIR